MPKIDNPITEDKFEDHYGNTFTLEKLPILDLYMVCQYQDNIPGYRVVHGYFYGSKDATRFFEEITAEWLCESYQEGVYDDRT